MDASGASAGTTRDGGFTLVELLVVLMVLGILSSIAISVFLRQRDRAWDAEVVSDLRGAVTAQHTFLASSSPEAFATDMVELASAGFSPSPGEAYYGKVFAMTVAGNGSQSFCMTARSASGDFFGFGSETGLVRATAPLDAVTCS
jgi:prepilin-type N-terminal cleavage/methylation domain-containing protein